MIRILCTGNTLQGGEEIAAAIVREYSAQTPPQVITDTAIGSGPVEWDDLLLVLYRSGQLSASAVALVEGFRDAVPTHQSLPTRRGIIPVALDASAQAPPKPIIGIKALLYDGSLEAQTRAAQVVGVFLGLAIRSNSHRVFISYRSTDGREIAKDLHDRLEEAGFESWLDEAPENLVPGDDVREVIHEHVSKAALVVLVDTPDAPASAWIAEEVTAAIGQLIPVLPVVVGPDDISRLLPLRSLRRRVPVKPSGVDRLALSDVEWEAVRDAIEEVLLAAYRRRLLILARAERSFVEAGFDWLILDNPRRMYQAERPQKPLPPLVVLSHCLIHDANDVPALKAYATFIDGHPDIGRVQQKLCIYDRERVLSDAEMTAIYDALASSPFILAHHNELGVLISSGFLRLR